MWPGTQGDLQRTTHEKLRSESNNVLGSITGFQMTISGTLGFCGWALGVTKGEELEAKWAAWCPAQF